MRRVCAFVLSLCLLWSGSVAPVFASMPCDMAEAAAASADDGAPPALPDCCLDADSAARTGQSCQPGGACALTGFALPVAGAAWSSAPARADAPVPASDAGLPAVPPGAVWRPPAHRG